MQGEEIEPAEPSSVMAGGSHPGGQSDTMQEYHYRLARFTVPGSPSGFGERGGDPYEWRIRCRDVARAAFAGLPLPLSQPVKVRCVFRVLRKARAHDLDNLVKPLIDALSAAGLFPESKSGGRKSEWNRDDSWVYALDVEKELVDERGETEVEVFLQEELDRAN
jgi:hypothetical protein